MPYPLVIWDFDGTLVDSLASAVGIFNRLAPQLGHRPVVDVAAARSLTTRQFLREHGVRFWRLPRLVRRFRAAAAEQSDTLRLVPGLAGVLDRLRVAGVKQGILSSNGEDNIRRALRANGVEGDFAFVVGYPKLFGKGKALRRIVRAERIAPSQVLYVGDEVRDVEAAHQAGVASAAVTWGFHTEASLRAARPDSVITDPAGLLDVVLGSRV